MKTRRLVSDACTLLVLLTLTACNGNNKNISQVELEPARPANDIHTQVDKALHDFFRDIDDPQ